MQIIQVDIPFKNIFNNNDILWQINNNQIKLSMENIFNYLISIILPNENTLTAISKNITIIMNRNKSSFDYSTRITSGLKS